MKYKTRKIYYLIIAMLAILAVVATSFAFMFAKKTNAKAETTQAGNEMISHVDNGRFDSGVIEILNFAC